MTRASTPTSASRSSSARASTSSARRPTEYRILAKRTELRPIASLRRMISAGEPLNPEVIRAFRERMGIGIGDGYGQTETGPVTGMRPGRGRSGPRRVDGPAAAGRSRRASWRASSRCRPDTVPTFFSHYLGESPFEGEWWPTGDHVRQDEDGYLWFEGRDDDIIITAGYRVGPFEVESALVSHPAVAEAAAVAAPDDERGSVVRAIVVLADGEPSDRARRRAPGARQAASPRPTSTRASSSSPTSCRRPRAARSSRAELRGMR